MENNLISSEWLLLNLPLVLTNQEWQSKKKRNCNQMYDIEKLTNLINVSMWNAVKMLSMILLSAVYCNTSGHLFKPFFILTIEDRQRKKKKKTSPEKVIAAYRVSGSVRPLGADSGHSWDVVRPLSEVRLQADVVLAAQYLDRRRRRHQWPHQFKLGIFGLFGLSRGAIQDKLHETGSGDHQLLAPWLRGDRLGTKDAWMKMRSIAE